MTTAPTVLDGSQMPGPHPPLALEHGVSVITRYEGPVVVGPDAVLVAGPGVCCQLEHGALVYLTPGSHVEDLDHAALARADISVVDVPDTDTGLRAALHAHQVRS